MAQDDPVAHFFGGQTQTKSPQPVAAPETDEFGLPVETAAAEQDRDGEIAVDVYQTDQNVVIVSPVAGVDPEEIQISAGQDTITISGQRQAAHTKKQHGLITQEIYWGSFSRTVQLPDGTAPERAQAAFKHGVLTVKVPKTEQPKKKTIKVQSDD